MGAIADYADLLVAVSEHTGHGDFAHLYPRFVLMAEARLSRLLRIGEQEVETTLTTDATGSATLPAFFREARVVRLQSTPRSGLFSGSPQQLAAQFPDAGVARAYAIIGGRLQTYPAQQTTISLVYYSGMPGLDAANPTNGVLDRYPDLYLQAVAREVYQWKRDVDAVKLTEDLLTRTIEEVRIDDERNRWGLGKVRLGAYP